MKKKIKDLTLEECNNICSKAESCSMCPLQNTIKCINTDTAQLDIEVEVDE